MHLIGPLLAVRVWIEVIESRLWHVIIKIAKMPCVCGFRLQIMIIAFVVWNNRENHWRVLYYLLHTGHTTKSYYECTHTNPPHLVPRILNFKNFPQNPSSPCLRPLNRKNRYSIDTGKNRSKYNKSDGGDSVEFVNWTGRHYDSKKTMAFQVSK